MKFVVSSSTLSTHLTTIGRVIVQKNNIPILDCFCFDIQQSHLTITASDNDSTFMSEIELNECDADVRFAINAKTLQDAIKEIPDQPLECYLNTETLELTIDYPHGQYKLIAQPDDDYPVPMMDDACVAQLNMPASALLTSVARSMVAAAEEDLRPQLHAVCFSLRKNELCIVASNGSHLAMTQHTIADQQCESDFLLSLRPANLLRAMLAKEQGDVNISFRERGATFSTEHFKLVCRLVDGRYPNFRSIIPQTNPYVVTLNRQAVVSVLRRVLVCANPSAVLVRFRLDSNRLNISSQDMDFGKSAEENMLCDYQGTPLRIAFKGSTLLELIQNIESEDVVFQLSDPSRAALILPAQQKENEMVLMLIMPSVFTE